MKPVHVVRLSLFVAVFGAALARPVLAAARACGPLVVDADAQVLRRWPELLEQVRATFAGRDEVEVCARVTLAMAPSGLTLEVLLADGRSASRSLTHRDDVVPVLEALLLVPWPEPEAPAPEPPAPASAPSSERAPPAVAPKAAKSAGPTPLPLHDETQYFAPVAARTWGIELSVVAGARIGEGQTSLGLGALSLLDLWGWLIGFQGRADSYGDTGSPQATLALGVLAGRRFEHRNVALDLIAGPMVVFPESVATVSTGPARQYREERSGVVPRLHFASHMHFGARSSLSAFIGIDAELGPRSSSPDEELPPPRFLPEPVETAPLPLWMVGVALGATVGTR